MEELIRVARLAEFYREELERCHACLQSQRDCYSACTVVQVEDALQQVMCRLDQLCRQGTADRVVSGILHDFSSFTPPQVWADGRFLH